MSHELEGEVDAPPTKRIERAEPLTLTRAVVRYRDGAAVLLHVLRKEAATLRQAGFRPHSIALQPDQGPTLVANLWTQDDPRLTDYLNAALLLYGDEPGSLSWEEFSQA